MKYAIGSADAVPQSREADAMARVGHTVRIYQRQQPGPSVEMLIDDEDAAVELYVQPQPRLL